MSQSNLDLKELQDELQWETLWKNIRSVMPWFFSALLGILFITWFLLSFYEKRQAHQSDLLHRYLQAITDLKEGEKSDVYKPALEQLKHLSAQKIAPGVAWLSLLQLRAQALRSGNRDAFQDYDQALRVMAILGHGHERFLDLTRLHAEQNLFAACLSQEKNQPKERETEETAQEKAIWRYYRGLLCSPQNPYAPFFVWTHLLHQGLLPTTQLQAFQDLQKHYESVCSQKSSVIWKELCAVLETKMRNSLAQ